MIEWLKSFKSRKARIEYLIARYAPGFHLHRNPVMKTKGLLNVDKIVDKTWGQREGGE